jgi:hypothetical protein
MTYFASDKRFDLDEISHRELTGNTTAGREWEV